MVVEMAAPAASAIVGVAAMVAGAPIAASATADRCTSAPSSLLAAVSVGASIHHVRCLLVWAALVHTGLHNDVGAA